MKKEEQYRITRGLEANPGAREIRREVFMEEQGFAREFGEEDDTALHITVYQGEEPVGTARKRGRALASGAGGCAPGVSRAGNCRCDDPPVCAIGKSPRRDSDRAVGPASCRPPV